MTPTAFVRTYGTLADEAAKLTSVSRWTILAQWAVETGWGTSALCIHDRNLAGIRWYGRAGTFQIGGTPGKVGTGFAGYSTLGAFVADYAHTLNLPAYAKVRAAVGVDAECRALGASPWDAGHYLSGGVVGGSLLAAWHALPVSAPAATYRLHLAPRAIVDHWTTGNVHDSRGHYCVTGHERRVWGSASSSAPCKRPIGRPLCSSMGTAIVTVEVTAGVFAGRHVQISPAHGVTFTKEG